MQETSAHAFSNKMIGSLEVGIFTGNASIRDLHTLLHAYTEKNNREQFLRITRLLHIWLQRVTHTMGKNVLYIKNTTHANYENTVFTFPFISEQLLQSPTSQYTTEFLHYLIRDYATDTILLDMHIAQKNPQVHNLVEKICQQCCKPFRIIGEQDARQLFYQIDKEDQDSFTQKMQGPSEIALSTLIGPCNIKCRFCEQAYKNFTYREADFETFKQAVRAIPPHKAIKTSLTPFQEPLTTQRFMPYLGFALQERPNADIGFNTNGILLTEKVSRTLIEMQCKYLVISLNMPNRESYLHFCGKDFFDVVRKNIIALHSLKAQTNSKYPVTKIQFLNAPPVTGNEQALTQEWSPYADSIFFTNIHAPTKDYHTHTQERLATQFPLEPGTPCSAMLGTCAIDMFGYYLPCCNLMIKRNEIAKRTFKFMEIGHVRDMDILTAWQSSKWQQLRAWQVAGLIACCQRCEINTAGLVEMKRNSNGMLQYIAKMLPTF